MYDTSECRSLDTIYTHCLLRRSNLVVGRIVAALTRLLHEVNEVVVSGQLDLVCDKLAIEMIVLFPHKPVCVKRKRLWHATSEGKSPPHIRNDPVETGYLAISLDGSYCLPQKPQDVARSCTFLQNSNHSLDFRVPAVTAQWLRLLVGITRESYKLSYVCALELTLIIECRRERSSAGRVNAVDLATAVR